MFARSFYSQELINKYVSIFYITEICVMRADTLIKECIYTYRYV